MAGTRNFLLEIGLEEVPARFMSDALKQLSDKAAELFREYRLEWDDIRSLGTPRRLTLMVRGLSAEQQELRQSVRGPSASVAFDAEGKPTRAAEGFARGQGVPVGDLQIEEVGGARYVFVHKVEPGKPAAQVLAGLLPRLILSLEWPKTMRWGMGDYRFVRPIHWLVALLDDEVVDFELAGIRSGRHTRGLRFLTPGPHEIASFDDYLATLEKVYIIADHEVRREMIRELVQQAARQAGGVALIEEDLLEEVTYLVEYPTPLVGTFASEYLEIPREVLMTSMRKHQRYFPVQDVEGRLLPMFIAVKNGPEAAMHTIRAGNEKVLRARLADAKFFYDEDRSRPLESFVPELQEMIFLEELGTVHQKTERIRKLGASIAAAAGVDTATADLIDRTLYLAKADLMTRMVYEFPEVEGIMGREYARLSGEKEAVAQGIFEHHLPRFSGDQLPQSVVGAVASLADKVDTVSGCFAIGIRPTGSQDPYGLRRHALGILQVLTRSRLNLSLERMVRTSLDIYAFDLDETRRKAIIADLMELFRTRLKSMMQDEGVRYDVVDAVVAAGFDNIYDVWVRAEKLGRLVERPEFGEVAVAHRRARNLGGKAEGTDVVRDLLREEPERRLHEAYLQARERASQQLSEGRYEEFFREVASLKEPLDHFLDKVMVMVEDEAVRKNRLSLLKAVADLMGQPADLEKLVV